jgi:hypothetical protein
MRAATYSQRKIITPSVGETEMALGNSPLRASVHGVSASCRAKGRDARLRACDHARRGRVWLLVDGEAYARRRSVG